MLKLLAAAIVAASIFAFAGNALADGEVGLVIHWGDGRVDTHCIAFEGDGIRGDQLLARAGYSVNEFSGLVCAIGSVGCQHSGSFNSCTCECQGGGDCTYWGFFLQPYGESWYYSALGLFSATANDGDLQGWKWGTGGAASAPVPPATSFEAVCGHPPGAVSTVPPSATTQPVTTIPMPTATPVPASSSPTPAPASTTAPSSPADDTPGTSPAATATAAATSSPTIATPAGEAATPTPSPTPAPPATGDTGGNGDTSNWQPIAFAAIAGALVLATIAALVTRSRRGA